MEVADVLPAGDPAETREKSKSWIAWLRGQGVVSAPRAETSPPEKTAKQSGATRSLDPCFTLPAKFSVENAEPDKEVPWLLPGALWDIASDGTAVDRVGRRTGQATLTDVGGGASVLRITWRWEDDSWEGQDVVSWLNREVNPRPGECALAGRGYSQVDRTQARYRHSRVDVTFQHID